MKKKIVICILAIFFLIVIFTVYVLNRIYAIDHDRDLLYQVSEALGEIETELYCSDDKESIEMYNSLLDGSVHFLHEISEDSLFGTLLIRKLSTKKYKQYYYTVNTIEEFESKIKTINRNKVIAMYYSDDGCLHVYIPESSELRLPFTRRREMQDKIKISKIKTENSFSGYIKDDGSIVIQ